MTNLRARLIPFLILLLPSGLVDAVGSLSKPDSSMAEHAELLVQRVDLYHRLLRDHEYTAAYDLLGAEWKRGEKDKAEWVEHLRKTSKRGNLISWRITEIRLSQNRAEVVMLIKAKIKRGFLRWEEGEYEDTYYWIHEDSTWNLIPFSPEDWDDDRSVSVPVPNVRRTPTTVEIEPRD